MLKVLIVQLKKSFTGAGFYLAAGLVFALCFTADIYYDSLKNENYSVIQVLLTMDHARFSQMTELSVGYVLSAAMNGWQSMLLPIIAAIPMVVLACDERISSSERYNIFRTSRFGFSGGKFFANMISAGLAVAVGFACFAVFTLFTFPPTPSEIPFSPWYIKIGETFVYGAFSSLPAFAIAGFARNKYIVLCVPFFIKYAMNALVFRMSVNAFADFENIDQGLADAAGTINPSALFGVSQSGKLMLPIVIYSLTLTVLAYLAYLASVYGRVDAGE